MSTVTVSEFGAGELEDVALHGFVAVVDDDQRGVLEVPLLDGLLDPLLDPRLHGPRRSSAVALRRHKPRRRHGGAQTQRLPLEELVRHEAAFRKPVISDRKPDFSTKRPPVLRQRGLTGKGDRVDRGGKKKSTRSPLRQKRARPRSAAAVSASCAARRGAKEPSWPACVFTVSHSEPQGVPAVSLSSRPISARPSQSPYLVASWVVFKRTFKDRQQLGQRAC